MWEKNHHQNLPFMRFPHGSGANVRAEFLSINLLSLDQDVAVPWHTEGAESLFHRAARQQMSSSYFLLLLPAWRRQGWRYNRRALQVRVATRPAGDAGETRAILTAYQKQCSIFPALLPFPLMGFCFIPLFFVLKSLGLLRR